MYNIIKMWYKTDDMNRFGVIVAICKYNVSADVLIV